MPRKTILVYCLPFTGLTLPARGFSVSAKQDAPWHSSNELDSALDFHCFSCRRQGFFFLKVYLFVRIGRDVDRKMMEACLQSDSWRQQDNGTEC